MYVTYIDWSVGSGTIAEAKRRVGNAKANICIGW